MEGSYDELARKAKPRNGLGGSRMSVYDEEDYTRKPAAGEVLRTGEKVKRPRGELFCAAFGALILAIGLAVTGGFTHSLPLLFASCPFFFTAGVAMGTLCCLPRGSVPEMVRGVEKDGECVIVDATPLFDWSGLRGWKRK